MYTLIRSITTRSVAFQQLLSFAISFGIAEFFYKFRSFALEAVAFLATWFVLDFVFDRVARRVRAARATQS